MNRELAQYLKEASRYGSRHGKAADYFAARKSETCIPLASAAKAAGWTALVLSALAGVYFGPDFVRYLKIRRM
jgi:hypothetical protein